MLPDRVSNPVPLTYESGDLPIALRGPAKLFGLNIFLFQASVHIHSDTIHIIGLERSCLQGMSTRTG